MRYLTKHRSAELSQGSMADIAFLLLTFYMMTTVIQDENGITLLLPQYNSEISAPIHDRNIFTIQINSLDQLLIEGELRANLNGVKNELKKFILNNGRDVRLSENPQKAVVSLKTDRGTSYKAFIESVDIIQSAYYEIYAEQAGITAEQFRKLDLSVLTQKKLYEKGRAGIPMNISIAEPTRMQ